MPQHVFISYAQEDEPFAVLLERRFESESYSVLRTHPSTQTEEQWAVKIEQALKTALAVIPLISPYSVASEQVSQVCALAKHYRRPLIPLLVSFVEHLPWYTENLPPVDATTDFDVAFRAILEVLPQPKPGLLFGDARDMYLQRATLKSAHTISAYHRAIELFFAFLAQSPRGPGLPIQHYRAVVPDEIPLHVLVEDDAPIFLHFAQWLLSPSSGKTGDKRPYKPSTVELRLAGVMNWFQFLDDHGWLPPQFKLAKAQRIVRDELRGRPQNTGAPQPPQDMEEVIYYYDTLTRPDHLNKPDTDPDRILRWELTRLRNRALLHCLAETGGRISEILSLNLGDFPVRALHKQDVLRVEVTGKGGHTYYLRFFDSIPVIRQYIEARSTNLKSSAQGKVPLFVSHDKNYDGNRMSRVIAWRVVQRASRALGLQRITPHDFRHWRATQLINAGHSLDVVQEYLGHRSVETTRMYYAHTDPLRVDDAAMNTRLPDPYGDNNN